MKTLTVELKDAAKDRSYPIFIGQGLMGQANLIEPYVTGKQVLIVSNTTVAPLYIAKARSMFADYDIQEVIFPDGEQYKNLEVLNKAFDVAIKYRFDRSCTFVALGGGVVGDMTGFAAASYQRGVNFIQIPTTLLSQVDSSVGGKTGVNHPLGKNMIGAFHQPQCVVVDIDSLSTLEDSELSSGLAEVIKYGLIEDLEFFEWLEKNLPGLVKKDPQTLITAIERSCKCKADIVSQDELERGKRALLNLGHTFGHAIEAGMGYGNWLHGEGVSAGSMQAVYLSHLLGDLTLEDISRIQSAFEQANLPIFPPTLEEMSSQKYLDLMAGDKKARAGTIRLVLLKKLGQAYVTGDYPRELLEKTLANWH